jgi:hypothetical protein
MIHYNEIKGILLWIILWNLADFLTDYFDIKSKNGIFISLLLLLVMIYFG